MVSIRSVMIGQQMLSNNKRQQRLLNATSTPRRNSRMPSSEIKEIKIDQNLIPTSAAHQLY
jgi:hypothetical protein